MSNKNKDSSNPTSEKSITVIEMRNGQDRYPFNYPISTLEAVVKCVRRYQGPQHQQIKANIYVHSKLRHQNLIQMTKALQSKNDSFFELRYEFVSCSLQSQVKTMKRQDLLMVRDSLQDLCSYLVAKNIAPPIDWQYIGITDKGIAKYFLPISQGQNLTFDKMAHFKSKRQQINKLFFELLPSPTPKPSVNPELTRSRSNQTVQNPVRTQYTSLHYSPPPRNSQSIQNKCESSFQEGKGLGNSRPSQTPVAGDGEKGDQAKKNVTQDSSPFSKLKDIDNRIRELRVVRSSNIQLQDVQMIKKSTLPINPQKPANGSNSPKNLLSMNPLQRMQPIAQNKRSPAPITKLPTQHINPKQKQTHSPPQSPPADPNKKRAFRYDQDSMDTYCQQLGENAQMPKIIATNNMRNTTNSPPKLFFNERSKDQKLSESVGFDQNIVIPLPVPANSVRSGKTEKSKSPTIPMNMVRANSNEGINLQQKVKMPMGMGLAGQVNLNVNVAVNLSDLSKKVDAAYGRVRAISQTAENAVKQLTLKAVATQPCFQKIPSSPPPRTTLPQPAPSPKQYTVVQQQQQPQIKAPTSQKKQPNKESQINQYLAPTKLAMIPEPRTSQLHPPPPKPCIPQLEVPYSKNRKHSATTPNIVLLSPAALQPHKNLFPQPQATTAGNNSPKGKDTLKEFPKPRPPQSSKHSESDRRDFKAQMEEDFKELRRKDTKDPQKDLKKDIGKELSKELGIVPEDEKSRQMLYRFENVFPDYNSDDYRDQTNSMRNPQLLQIQREQLYNQSLKFEDDALVSEFGALFDAEKQVKSLQTTQKQQKSEENIRLEKSDPAIEPDKNMEIKERVKLAFEKSKTTLSQFNRVVAKRVS